MFDFAFGIAVALILPMLGTHYYFRDKIRKNYESKKDEYSKMMAKAQVDSFKNLIEKHLNRPTPPYDELEKYYFNLHKKEFEGLDGIVEALRIENLLYNAMFFFFVAIALFLFTGVFPYIFISDYSLSGFSTPSMISGVIAVIIACIRIYQIGKKV